MLDIYPWQWLRNVSRDDTQGNKDKAQKDAEDSPRSVPEDEESLEHMCRNTGI